MGEVLDRAISFACVAHAGQMRKLVDTPYILHPLEALTIAGTMTNDEEVLAATVLHDTVEDTTVSLEDIEKAFGPRVADLVASETENKRPDRPGTETWRIRKEESLKWLEDSDDIAVKIMWMSDKLSNMRSFCRGYNNEGDAMWEHFNQKDRKQQEWYYRMIAALLKPMLGDTIAWKEFSQLIEFVFGGRRI